jgi:hypothetical protein
VDGRRAYESSVTEAQQSALVFNMSNNETSQLFDWVVSGSEAFALIERLPRIVTKPALSPADAAYVGLDRAYVQIIKSAALKVGTAHNYAIRYTRTATLSDVEHLLEGVLFAHVDHVGIPLDVQNVDFAGAYPSHAGAAGESSRTV